MISTRAWLLKLVMRLVVRKRPGKKSIADFRRLARFADQWFKGNFPQVIIHDKTLGSVGVRCIGPKEGEVNGTLFFIHGGAWCIDTPNMHTGLCVRLALAMGMQVLMPHYRLAPEHQFPAASEDCFAAWQGLLKTAVMPSDVVLVGDSAGGALALGLLGQIRDAGLTMPRCALLLPPATDLATTGRSVIDNAKTDVMFHITALMLFRHWYLGDTAPTDPLASPYWGDFTGFPPLMFQVSGAEMLLDNSIMAEAKARSQGVITKLSIWPGMPHDFVLFGFIPEAKKGILELAKFVRSASHSAEAV